MRTAVQLAGLVLLLGGLTTACGDGDDGGDKKESDAKAESAEVSTKEFCSKFASLYTDALAGIDRTDPKAAITATKKWASDMDDLGAPKDMGSQEKEGFDVFVDTLEGLDENGGMEQLQNAGNDLPKDKQAAGKAFGDWTEKNCPIDSAPSESSSASPSGG